MDVLVVTLWLLGIIISHLLLRRVVEIDNMNKQLLKEKKQPKMVEEMGEDKPKVSDEDLKKELLEYVQAQEYQVPKANFEFELPKPSPVMIANMNMEPKDASNIIQQFSEERDLNTGSFGNLQAYEDVGFASI